MCALPHQLLLKEHPTQKMCRTEAFKICPFWKAMDCPPFIQELLAARWQPRPQGVVEKRASKMVHVHSGSKSRTRAYRKECR